MMFAVGTTPYSGNDYTYSLQLEVIRQEQFSSIRTYWDYPNYILFNVAFDLGNDTSPTSSTFTAYFVGYTPESNSTCTTHIYTIFVLTINSSSTLIGSYSRRHRKGKSNDFFHC